MNIETWLHLNQPARLRQASVTVSQQAQLALIVDGYVARSARLSPPRAPPECRLDFILETFAAQCKVAVGGVAYLPDNFLVEVRLEYGVVSFAPDFFTGCACSVSDVAHYGLWVGGAGDLLDTAGGTAGAIVKWREQPRGTRCDRFF